jgi:hypothetical protein
MIASPFCTPFAGILACLLATPHMLVSAQNASSAAGAVGRFVALSCDAGKSNVNRRDETNAPKTAAGSAPHGLDNLKEFDDVDAALAASIFCQ